MRVKLEGAVEGVPNYVTLVGLAVSALAEGTDFEVGRVRIQVNVSDGRQVTYMIHIDVTRQDFKGSYDDAMAAIKQKFTDVGLAEPEIKMGAI